MSMEVRRARPADRKKILDISAQIWDGYDYVPLMLDEWLAGTAGELLVAVLDGGVAAFSYRTWVAEGHAWLQGIRTDTALRGKGLGRALTERSIERAWADGARRIGLSTYVDNQASMHIVESFGFRRMASFVYLEGDLPGCSEPEDTGVVPLADGEAIRVIGRSDYLAAANGRFPWEWKFLSFDWSPRAAIAWAPYRIGIRRDGKVVSALCASPGSTPSDAAFLSFLDGEPDDLLALLRHAQADLGAAKWEAMVPKDGDRGARALAVLRDSGLRSWTEFSEDVFSYELDRVPALSREAQNVEGGRVPNDAG
ncbi:MAG: GNAT family N-acetyltransferase [Candidatus Bipolaricaulota bacterium]|nr:GNAT family N-acetyltransferase [Candidatus Bipolaricaulota bacterium]